MFCADVPLYSLSTLSPVFTFAISLITVSFFISLSFLVTCLRVCMCVQACGYVRGCVGVKCIPLDK